MPYKDIEKQRAAWRKNSRVAYYKDPDKHIKAKRLRNLKIRKWLKEYKKKLKCSRCPETHFSCIQFHHVKGKKIFNIGGSWGYGIDRIKEEMLKCIVICANCHAKEHAK